MSMGCSLFAASEVDGLWLVDTISVETTPQSSSKEETEAVPNGSGGGQRRRTHLHVSVFCVAPHRGSCAALRRSLCADQ